ncbi:serine endopeptidase [Pseudomonas oryzihabitans]|uniref:serine endopeptidase n=1 Tax=Pseudomonas oryzihabitans TaxID=47885 RepID=UPI00135D1D00|nr:serine endopeptidase [Pseudomonas oryzihabitans]MXS21349.1 serine endopeptidase [Pseudomonas oryzihabitans]
MGKSLRLSEKWFNRGLWLLALVFAGFLIGLGGTLVGDLPQVERQQGLEDFMDPVATATARGDQRQAHQARRTAQDALDQAQLQQTAAARSYRANRETFDNWLATRQSTQRPEQDAELIARSRALDDLKAGERRAEQQVERQEQALLDAEQRANAAERTLASLGESAQSAWLEARQQAELRVFLYRLALTLPLLAVAAWLFVRQRKSAWWPFVWGFIFFALFAFFVELVPYLPSYGGYVRYLVGILLTVLGGRHAIRALQDYRARLALKEAQPDTVRREELHYDTALARLAKGVCPGCERPVDLKDAGIDFCPHCGIGLHDHCGACQTRKSAFAHFCQACGTAARGPVTTPAAPTTAPG